MRVVRLIHRYIRLNYSPRQVFLRLARDYTTSYIVPGLTPHNSKFKTGFSNERRV